MSVQKFRSAFALFPSFVLLVSLGTLGAGEAHAYIGPGAGFALGGSMLVLLATFTLAFAIILTWPIRLVYRLIKVGNPYKSALAKRGVILALDGEPAAES